MDFGEIASMTVRLALDSVKYAQGLAKTAKETTSWAKGIESKVNEAASQFTGLGRSLLKIGAIGAGAGLLAVSAALGGAATAGLSFNNQLEQTSARIQAFTKDAGQTAKMLDFVKKEAAATPFAFQDMAEATASLLPAAKASGNAIEDLIGQAEILAASNPAEGLTGAAFSLKEALSGDFVSIVERFNLPRKLINDLKEQGVPALEIVSQAMKSMGLDADLVGNLAKTASGRWSTFKDTLVNLTGIVTKPIFDTFSGGLGVVNDLLDSSAANLESVANWLAGGISAGITLVTTEAQNLVQAFQSGGTAGLVAALGLTPEANALIDKITGSITAVANSITGMLQPALAGLSSGGILDSINQAIVFMNQNWESFAGAIVGVGAALAAAAIAAAVVGIAGAIAGLVTPVGLIIAGAALLGAAWGGNWFGIQEKTLAAWAVVQPILSQVWTWLGINIPAAIGTASAYWTGTLLPAIQTVWAFTQKYILPLLASVANLVGAVVGKALQANAGLWQNVLLPAVNKVWSFINGSVLPILSSLISMILDKVSPGMGDLSGGILPKVVKGLEKVSQVIKDVTGYFNSLANAVSNFSLPDVLTPGSPTPLEIALVGIAKATGQAAEGFINLSRSLAGGQFQSVYDKLFKIDRSTVSPLNVLGAAADDVEKFLDKRVSRSKSGFVLTALKNVYKANIDALSNAADPRALFRQLAASAVSNWEKAGVKLNDVLGAADTFASRFAGHLEEAQEALQQMILEGAKQAVDFGKKINDFALSAVDRLNTKVGTLYDMLQTGAETYTFEGQILSAVEAQNLYNQALQEQLDSQQAIADLQNNQAQLSFLQQQIDLIEQATSAGLNLTDVFGGMSFGLDASLPDLIAATNAVVQAMIDQIDSDLQMHSPSRVMIDKGRDIMASLASGMASAINLPVGAMNSAAQQVTNYNYSPTINVGGGSSVAPLDFASMRSRYST